MPAPWIARAVAYPASVSTCANTAAPIAASAQPPAITRANPSRAISRATTGAIARDARLKAPMTTPICRLS